MQVSQTWHDLMQIVWCCEEYLVLTERYKTQGFFIKKLDAIVHSACYFLLGLFSCKHFLCKFLFLFFISMLLIKVSLLSLAMRG
jgi:hypothetical protein